MPGGNGFVMNRTIVDANVILRYLLNDVELLSRKASSILESKSTLAPTEVICEVVHVLDGVYDVGREQFHDVIARLFDSVDLMTTHTGVLFEGLSIYRKSTLDFVDCLLCAYKRVEGMDVETFDKKLLKQLQR